MQDYTQRSVGSQRNDPLLGAEKVSNHEDPITQIHAQTNFQPADGESEIESHVVQQQEGSSGITKIFSFFLSHWVPTASAAPQPLVQVTEMISSYDMLKSEIDEVETDGSGNASAKGILKILEQVYQNPEMRHDLTRIKREGGEFYSRHRHLIDFVVLNSYLINEQFPNYQNLSKKKDILILQLNNSHGVIRESDKITPSQANLIGKFISSSIFTENFLDKIEDDGLKERFREILSLNKEWKTFLEENVQEHLRPGDILIHDLGMYTNYVNPKGVKALVGRYADVVHRKATGSELGHAAVYQEDKERTPRFSHVTDTYWQGTMQLLNQVFLLNLRIQPYHLLNDDGKQAMKYLGIKPKELEKKFQSLSQELHSELKDRETEMKGQITNRHIAFPIGIIPAMLGKGVSEEEEHGMKKIRDGNMICSEFSGYATLIVINSFNQFLKDELEKKVTEQLDRNEPIPDSIQKIHSNLDKGRLVKTLVKRTDNLSPTGLARVLVRENVASWSPPSPPFRAVFQNSMYKHEGPRFGNYKKEFIEIRRASRST